MTLVLHSYWRSSCSWRVRIALNLKNVDYQIVPVDLSPSRSAQHDEGFGGLNPLRQVPVLEVPGGREGPLRLTQSMAIVEYLEERFREPPLLPESADLRAACRQAAEVVNAAIQPLQNVGTLARLHELLGEVPDGVRNERVQAWCRTWISRGLETLEGTAKAHGTRFLIGNAPTIADVFLVPQMYNARRFELSMDPYPALLRVEQACESLAAFQRARPERQPDAPSKDGGST